MIPLFVKIAEDKTHALPRAPVFRKNYDYDEFVWNTMNQQYGEGKIKGIHDFMKKKRKEPSPIKLWKEKRNKRKKKIADILCPLSIKIALQITVKPDEPLVQKSIQLVEQKWPGLLKDVKEIVVEPGDPGHLGQAKSDTPDKIYISVDKIKNKLGPQANEEDIIDQISMTIAHEEGHIESKFQGGEAPAEAKEQAFKSRLGI